MVILAYVVLGYVGHLIRYVSNCTKATYKEVLQHVPFSTVKTGISDFEHIEIVGGLKEGQQIIVGPYATVAKKLKNGELVKKKGGK